MNEARGNMPASQADRIRTKWTFLLDEIDAKDLSDDLFEKLILSRDDLEIIQKQTSKKERNKTFLGFLLNAGPNAYNEFVNALRKRRYEKVLETLEKDPDEATGNIGMDQVPPTEKKISESSMAPIAKEEDNGELEQSFSRNRPSSQMSLGRTPGAEGAAFRDAHSPRESLKFEFDDGRVRMIMIGVKGSGKSTTCNRILGEEKFRTTSAGANIAKSVGHYGIRYRQHIYLVDTPGLGNFIDFNHKLFMNEMKAALKLSEPGPHAFVCVTALGQSAFEITSMLSLMKKYMTKEIFKYMAFVMTNSEKITENETKEDIIHPELKTYLDMCGHRQVTFSTNPSDETQENEVKQLLDVIHTMTVKNSPKFFKLNHDISCSLQ